MQEELKDLKKELQRAKEFESFLYIVVECTLEDVELNNFSSNIPYIHHNMRELTHQFSDTCQFLLQEAENALKKLFQNY